jgi:predicted ATPase
MSAQSANSSQPSSSVAAPSSTDHASALGHSHWSSRDVYTQLHADCEGRLRQLSQRQTRMVWLRTILCALTVIGLAVGYLTTYSPIPFRILGWVAGGGFLIAIVLHEHMRLARLQLESDQRLCTHLLARLDRKWEDIPTQELLPEFQQLAYADDLDMAGRTGLLSLVGLARTYPGRRVLQAWMSHPTPWPEILRRQQAVQTLASDRDLRLKVLQSVQSTSTKKFQPYGLPDWASGEAWLPQHPLAHVLSFVGPGLVIAAILVIAAGTWLAASQVTITGAILLAAGFLINIAVTVFWGSWIHDIFQRVTGEHRACHQFASLFALMSELPSSKKDEEKTILDEIRCVASESPKCAVAGFKSLLGVVRLANMQRDPLLYVVYLCLQLTVLYDFRILYILEKWQAKFGDQVAEWFEALGTCEALVSCATLADDYPDWCYPVCPQASEHLLAEDMGHPLLADSDRVTNSLTIEKSRPLVVVTGSNMAGKSTFLRSIGLNIILARTGSPVCARRFETPSYELATSIRVQDSLSDGVSFFMAELKRLKEVVDLAREHNQTNQQGRTGATSAPVLFLLDEILQGTNSQERQIAVASVLEQLLESQAIGFISTHDLDLAEAPEVKAVSQVVHFREYFETQSGKEVMRFDYRMRSGPTPTTNALKLLQLVGLDAKSGNQ